ncbi:sterol carrier protein domain-containing protein [Streptomyces sp. NPDC048650]|uniref:sterol carrier protein domain-containing protein n=1 Tax=Streptomyces sp. NPDC048650 TaxID=3365583 RepID=UPI003720FAE5
MTDAYPLRPITTDEFEVWAEGVLDVEDPFCPWNTGRHRLRADGDLVTCDRTTAPADLHVSVSALGAAFLGGTTPASLAAAGSSGNCDRARWPAARRPSAAIGNPSTPAVGPFPSTEVSPSTEDSAPLRPERTRARLRDVAGMRMVAKWSA